MTHSKSNLLAKTRSTSPHYPDPSEADDRLIPVMQLARVCGFEVVHSLHVTHLALQLFDGLQAHHGLGEQERFYLQAGGLLHDIGWIEGWRSHHKTSLAIILRTPILQFSNKERLIIGSIARYHRRTLPKPHHDHFAALDYHNQRLVKTLASLLRVADGLDRTHQNLVQDVTCKVSDEKITLLCKVLRPAEDERASGLEKGDLLEKVFKRKLGIEWV
jgi:exopolyphosphatase/pppGpp-phosphohydrolase